MTLVVVNVGNTVLYSKLFQCDCITRMERLKKTRCLHLHDLIGLKEIILEDQDDFVQSTLNICRGPKIKPKELLVRNYDSLIYQ
jgi:hypothetical protein